LGNYQKHKFDLNRSLYGFWQTETALAYAWQLLALGLADSIVFALPTQATANAMLNRLENAAPLLFANQTNVVLAHGRAKYQENFINLKEACRPRTAKVMKKPGCNAAIGWRKAASGFFLDKSVFVPSIRYWYRCCRLNTNCTRLWHWRSVLIIDEVHAYDSYMYGLLEAVLEQHAWRWQRNIVVSHLTIPNKKYNWRRPGTVSWSPSTTLIHSSVIAAMDKPASLIWQKC